MHRNQSRASCDGCRNAATHEIKTAKYARGNVVKRLGNWCDSCDPPTAKRSAKDALGRKTRTIAGHRITLTDGIRYIATRPMADRTQKVFPVIISKWPASVHPVAVVTIPGLSYEAANKLVNAFNNGATSFDGRVW